jgi:hypothetical protein
MMRYIPISLAAAVFGLAFLTGGSAPTLADKGPVVVELYTSQGCNSCPPADAFLGELAKRENVIALSFHVTYWDYLGWKDRFAFKGATKRQRAYGRHFRRGFVYTPQMVIDGQSEVVGSHRGTANRAINKAARRTDKINVAFKKGADGKIHAVLPMRQTSGAAERATVWFVLFDKRHTTDIKRGENGGRKLTYHNVVRTLTELGNWNGEKKSIALPVDAPGPAGRRDGCAVIVQSNQTGRILGAAVMPLAQTN